MTHVDSFVMLLSNGYGFLHHYHLTFLDRQTRVAEKLTEDEMVIQKFRKLWSLAKIGSTQEQQLQLTRVNNPLGGTQSCDVAIVGPGDRKEGQLFTFINNTMNRRGRYPIYPKRIQTFRSDK